MKIALVSLYFDPNAMAIRLLSSVLKRDFPNDIINIVLLNHKAKPPRMDFDLETPEDLKAIQKFFAKEQFDIVGISLMTNYLNRAIQLSNAIRAVSNAKILWGGIHPTLCPEECSWYADIIFVGEAEIALPEVVRRIKINEPLDDMPGIWHRKNGKPTGEGHCPSCPDLNLLPLPDYDFNSQFIYAPENHQVVQMRREYISKSNFAFYGGPAFHRIMTARGCVQACSYCINSQYQKLLGLEKAIRQRSIDSVFNELEKALSVGVFKKIVFIDDDLFLRSEEWLEEFAALYRKKIRLPFTCNVTPIRTTAAKVRALNEAGVTAICMGVQTGSDRLNHDVYNRKIDRRHVIQAAQIMYEHASRVTRAYDFLVRSPYETLNDKIETIKLLLQLHPPYEVHAYALTFFPGLPITEQAKKSGIMQSHCVQSIYDYDGSREDCEWKMALETLGTKTSAERQQMLEILEHRIIRSTSELLALTHGTDRIMIPSSEEECKMNFPRNTTLLPHHTGVPAACNLDIQTEQAMINVMEKSLKIFPLLRSADLACAMEYARAIRRDIIGRAPGDIGDKIAQYAAVLQCAREHPELATINALEIGTLFGGSCLQMLGALRTESRQGKITCIDPFDGYYGKAEDLSKAPVTTDTLIRNLHLFGFSESHVEIRATKSEAPLATKGLKEKDFMVALIDGDHAYEGVRSDWTIYNRYVADGGYLLFDDYGDPAWTDLTRAIDDICQSLPPGWNMCGSLGTTLILRRIEKHHPTPIPPASPWKSAGHRYLKTLLGLEIAEALLVGALNTLHSEELNLIKCRTIIGERDRAIAELKKIVANRERTIVDLKKTLADRDRNIADHKRTVLERDRTITSLQGTAVCRSQIIAGQTRIITRHNQTISRFVQAQAQIQWQLLRYRDQIDNVVLFGAGKHTAWLLEIIKDLKGPSIATILDDQATADQMLFGIPVIKPEKWNLKKCKTIVLSTDTFQENLTNRCRELWGDKVEAIDFYKGLPPGPYPKTI